MTVILVVWKNEPEDENGLRQAKDGPVHDKEYEDITAARMHYYKGFFHGHNGQIQSLDGKILALLS